MDGLPSTIDDLLEMTAADGASGWCGTSPPSALPSLVIFAESDGSVHFADDFGSGLAEELAGPLARQAAAALAQQRTWSREVETPLGGRLALAFRLPEGAGGAILACLIGLEAENVSGALGAMHPSARCDKGRLTLFSHPLDELHAVAIVCGAMARTAAHYKAREAELQARTQQLRAGQEALRMSYCRTLASAVEERENRLREQEEHTARLQALMMTAAEGIITIDEEGTIESFNAAATRIFGYAPQEAIGQNVSLLMPPPHSRQHGEYLARYLRGDKAGAGCMSRELVGKRKDGTLFPLELAVSEVLLGQRRVFTGILRDITDRKQAEQELRRLHLHNKMILDSAGEGIVGLDRQGRVVFVNPAAGHMVGWSSQEMVGKPLHQLIHHTKPTRRPYPWEECPVYRTLCEGEIYRVDREVFWRKDGSDFPVEYVTTPMREGDEIVGAVLAFQDVTQRRMLEGQLVQAQKLESIGQLAAGIAHEINTPTQFIGDNMRFLEDAVADLKPLLAANRRLLAAAAEGKIAPSLVAEVASAARNADLDYLLEEIPKAIGQSLEGVERVANIVRAMKEFSHPGSAEMQAVDLNKAIQNTLTVCRNEWKYVADVVTDLDPALPPVTCLPNECNQVLLNLIINAAHAIEEKQRGGAAEKGTITVSTRSDGDWVEIRVADTGTGIAEQYRTKVFDPFFTTKEVGKGTGQGLAIARSVLVDKHGGTLSFETEVGRGTTFIARLPRRPRSSSRGADA